MPPRYAVLMTCHNRRELTLEALRKLSEQNFTHETEVALYVVDDGSTDGTSEAIRSHFPGSHLLMGDGSLYWAGGMRLAFSSAVCEDYDGYFWLNDDTFLQQDACQRVLLSVEACAAGSRAAIGVGSILDPDTLLHAYGGLRFVRQGMHADFVDVTPEASRAVLCDTMNGNFVYIPRRIANTAGSLDAVFTHQYGDLDYGLRARRFGFDIVVTPGYVGTCRRNQQQGTWQDSTLPFRERWAKITSPKGVPPLEWTHFIQRHYGWRWPLYAVSPYFKAFLGSCLAYHRGGMRKQVRTH